MEPVQDDSITLQCFVSAVEQQQANLGQQIIDTFGSTMATILADTIKTCFQEGSKSLNMERAKDRSCSTTKGEKTQNW